MEWIEQFDELSNLDEADRQFLRSHTRVVSLDAGQSVFARQGPSWQLPVTQMSAPVQSLSVRHSPT